MGENKWNNVSHTNYKPRMNEITHQTIQAESIFKLHSLLMDFRINYDCSSKNPIREHKL